MKLALGMRVVRDGVRYRVIEFSAYSVKIRRVMYREALVGDEVDVGSWTRVMEWVDTADDVVESLRANFEILYTPDTSDVPS